MCVFVSKCNRDHVSMNEVIHERISKENFKVSKELSLYAISLFCSSGSQPVKIIIIQLQCKLSFSFFKGKYRKKCMFVSFKKVADIFSFKAYRWMWRPFLVHGAECRRRRSWRCWGSTRRSSCCSYSGCWWGKKKKNINFAFWKVKRQLLQQDFYVH